MRDENGTVVGVGVVISHCAFMPNFPYLENAVSSTVSFTRKRCTVVIVISHRHRVNGVLIIADIASPLIKVWKT